MINDFEYLYMIRQHDEDALSKVMDKFNRLIWKRAHDFYQLQKPQGIKVEDLYQEGFIGFFDSLFAYRETREVGFAFYVNLCVESCIKTALRRCRGQSYRLLDSNYSFDMAISEDESLYLIDVIEDESYATNPQIMAHVQEAQTILDRVLASVTATERDAYIMRDEGFSYHEIALNLDISQKQVDNIIQKVRRKLVKEHPV